MNTLSRLNNSYLLETEKQIEELARKNLEAPFKTGSYTGPQKMAMLAFEKLRLTSGIELTTMLLRGKFLETIEKHHLYAEMPGNEGGDMEAAVEDYANLSRTQQSVIMNLYRIVLPYIQDELGRDINEFWESSKKSNLYDALPFLRAVITGERSKSKKVNDVVEKLHIEFMQAGYKDLDARKRAIVEHILDQTTLTNDEMTKVLQGGEEELFNAIVLRRNGTAYLIMELDHDQLERMQRKLQDKADWTYIDLNKENPTRLPIIKSILALPGGS
jgi:hypothetical protein